MRVEVKQFLDTFTQADLSTEVLHRLINNAYSNKGFMTMLCYDEVPYLYLNLYTKEYGVCFDSNEDIDDEHVVATELYKLSMHLAS